MILRRNCRKILFKELNRDEYRIKTLPTNSIGTMLDLGANVGIISILARLLHPKMKIYAFEPHEELYNDLCSNVANLLIKPVNRAFGNGSCFYLETERKSNVCNSFKKTRTDSRKIKSMTLQQIVEQFNIDPDDLFIKMDIEGAEEYLLDNDNDFDILRRCKLFALEVHPLKLKNTKLFLSYLSKLKATHTENITNQRQLKTLTYIKL